MVDHITVEVRTAETFGSYGIPVHHNDVRQVAEIIFSHVFNIRIDLQLYFFISRNVGIVQQRMISLAKKIEPNRNKNPLNPFKVFSGLIFCRLIK